MRADLALFLTTITSIAIVALIVKNASGSASVIRETGDAMTSLYGSLASGNPAFYERRTK